MFMSSGYDGYQSFYQENSYDGHQTFCQDNGYGYGRDQGEYQSQLWRGDSHSQGVSYYQPSQGSVDPEIISLYHQIMDGYAKESERMSQWVDACSRSLDSIIMSKESVGHDPTTYEETLTSSSQGIMDFLPDEIEIDPQAHCNVILPNKGDDELVRQKLKDKEQMEENERALEEIARLLESPYDEKIAKDEKLVDDSTTKKPYVPPPYEPKVPFPPRVYTKREKSTFSEFKKGLGQIGITLPLNENLAQVPLQLKFIKNILANKERVEEMMKIFEPPSKPLLKPKELPKLGDPGKFIIPCCLGEVELDDALCDSGACVNVISLAMAKEIGIKEMKPDSTSITFGDASSKTPVGLVEDFPIIVDGCIVPTDLLVVDMVESKKQPLVLGTPFLNTVGAKIDFVSQKVVLTNVNNKIFYPIKSPFHKSCGTITRGEAIIELKESTIVEDTPSLVKDVFKGENKLENELPLENATTLQDVETKLKVSTLIEDTYLFGIKDVVCEHEVENVTSLNLVAPLEKVEKKPKQEVTKDKVVSVLKKKKRLVKPSCMNIRSSPPSLTFKPLNIIDGKLECKVKSNGNSRPFAKVKIILDPVSKEDGNLGVVSAKMARLFEMNFKDKGPFQDGSSSST